MKKTPTKWIRRFCITIIILSGLWLALGFFFHSQAIHFDTRQGKSQLDRFIDEFDYKHFTTLRSDTSLRIPSEYGYDLSGMFIYNPDTSQNTMIICHGIGGDRWGVMKVSNVYLDKGFNVLLYDHRNHGLSGGTNVGFGYYEHKDLETVVQYVKSLYPEGIIGVHGESFGGGTAVMHSGVNEADEDVSFYVIDCAYSDVPQLFTHRLMGDFGLPNLMIIEFASLANYLHEGFFFGEVSPVSVVKNVETPMLFIHGDDDDYVPTYMSRDMFDAKPGEKDLYLVSGAKHAKAFEVDKVAYTQRVHGFIDEALR